MGSLLYDFDISYGGGSSYIAGVDEAGRGSLAGPVVASAVILDLSLIIPFLDDSKRLSSFRREEVFLRIKESALDIGVGVVGHEVIDEVNILNASKRAMYEALDGLLRVRPDIVLVDGVFLSDLEERTYSVIKGDMMSASIAAASVVAKCTRDSIMRFYDNVFPGYFFACHKGYATRAHLEALGKKGVSGIHRRTYRRVRELI